MLLTFLQTSIRALASLKVAIPLLVLLTIVTIVGSLFPEPDVFYSPLYLALMGLLGISLLFVTIMHAPMILVRKGRNALIGVVTTHLGILVLIGAFIYGGTAGFRHNVRLIEGEITVVPGVPFVMQLDRLNVEDYGSDDYPGIDLSALPKKRQNSHITLLKQGKPWREIVAAPGKPARVNGIIILPAVNDIGWTFELVTVDPRGKTGTIPVRPWAPPVISLGPMPVMAHGVMQEDGATAVELFTLEGDEVTPLGIVSTHEPIAIQGHTLSLGAVKRFTGVQIYNRPQEPVLIAGSTLMFAGLVWHFYFRHRDRRRETRRA